LTELPGTATGAAGKLAQAWRVLATDPPAAEAAAAHALLAAPADAAATLLLGTARRLQGNVAGAHAVLAPLAARTPRDAAVQFELGMVCAARGDEAAAIAALRRCTQLRNDVPYAWRALGDLLVLEGDWPGAGQAYAGSLRAATASTPLAEAADALCNGRAAAAEAAMKAYTRQNGENPVALLLLAHAAMRVGRTRQAAAVLAHCLAVAPGFTEARHALAILLYGQENWRDAVPPLRDLVGQAPRDTSLRKLLTGALVRFGDYAEAVPHYEQLLGDFAAQPKLLMLHGHALKSLGRAADAQRAYRACIAMANNPAGAWLSLADIKTAAFTDADIEALRTQLARRELPADERARLHYALGHALEQRGHDAGAFAQYAAGAKCRRAGLSYDAAAHNARLAQLRATFTPAFFAARAGAGCADASPIFVVGLPRSGSTLVEQILASHCDVEATSELAEIADIAGAIGGKAPPAHGIATLVPADLRGWGEHYLARTARFRRLGRPRFIDKMPENFVHAGLIHLILPNATILDVRRAPMAAGFAAYKQFFQTGREYSYDLTDLGRYVRDYTALMAHLDTVLPGRVYRLHYEDLVTDTESQIRALLAHCHLSFQAGCLRFWETARPVQTPSAQQVRLPVYREGLDHWRRFAPWLEPLRLALQL
jgi:Flp pilus assembly protein TadD